MNVRIIKLARFRWKDSARYFLFQSCHTILDNFNPILLKLRIWYQMSFHSPISTHVNLMFWYILLTEQLKNCELQSIAYLISFLNLAESNIVMILNTRNACRIYFPYWIKCLCVLCIQILYIVRADWLESVNVISTKYSTQDISNKNHSFFWNFQNEGNFCSNLLIKVFYIPKKKDLSKLNSRN